MNPNKYVFAQLTAFLNRTQFNNFVRKYDGNRYVKQFTCWNQLLAMVFGQLSNRESLRNLIVAFDSTTIPLCLSTFPWAKFRRKKGGVKAHILYDIEAQVPAFYTVTTASKNDSTAMSIHYEPNTYYKFDGVNDSFKEIYRILLTGSFYIVRAMTNLECKMSNGRKECQRI